MNYKKKYLKYKLKYLNLKKNLCGGSPTNITLNFIPGAYFNKGDKFDEKVIKPVDILIPDDEKEESIYIKVGNKLDDLIVRHPEQFSADPSFPITINFIKHKDTEFGRKTKWSALIDAGINYLTVIVSPTYIRDPDTKWADLEDGAEAEEEDDDDE